MADKTIYIKEDDFDQALDQFIARTLESVPTDSVQKETERTTPSRFEAFTYKVPFTSVEPNYTVSNISLSIEKQEIDFFSSTQKLFRNPKTRNNFNIMLSVSIPLNAQKDRNICLAVFRKRQEKALFMFSELLDNDGDISIFFNFPKSLLKTGEYLLILNNVEAGKTSPMQQIKKWQVYPFHLLTDGSILPHPTILQTAIEQVNTEESDKMLTLKIELDTAVTSLHEYTIWCYSHTLHFMGKGIGEKLKKTTGGESVLEPCQA